MTPRTYEITFLGAAAPAVVQAFDDCDVIVDPERTTLRAAFADQAALRGALDRAMNLGLELVEVRSVSDPPPVAR